MAEGAFPSFGVARTLLWRSDVGETLKASRKRREKLDGSGKRLQAAGLPYACIPRRPQGPSCTSLFEGPAAVGRFDEHMTLVGAIAGALHGARSLQALRPPLHLNVF